MERGPSAEGTESRTGAGELLRFKCQTNRDDLPVWDH